MLTASIHLEALPVPVLKVIMAMDFAAKVTVPIDFCSVIDIQSCIMYLFLFTFVTVPLYLLSAVNSKLFSII